MQLYPFNSQEFLTDSNMLNSIAKGTATLSFRKEDLGVELPLKGLKEADEWNEALKQPLVWTELKRLRVVSPSIANAN